MYEKEEKEINKLYIVNRSARYKVCRGYFLPKALRFCCRERGLTCAGKVALEKKGKYLTCPECGWHHIYTENGELIDTFYKYDPVKELDDLNREMIIKMRKKSEIARIMGTD